MQLAITVETGFVRMDMIGRRSAAEMRPALERLIATCRARGLYSILAVVRASVPIFKVEQFGFSALLQEMSAAGAPWKVALVSDTPELRAAHEYIATLARQQGIDARAFSREPPALHWLRSGVDLGRRYRFSRTVIAGAPAEPGVYTLWQEEEVIYYGCARGGATIRSRLMDHLAAGAEASHYSWEISRDPAAREHELLQRHRMAFGRLPRLNEAR